MILNLNYFVVRLEMILLGARAVGMDPPVATRTMTWIGRMTYLSELYPKLVYGLYIGHLYIGDYDMHVWFVVKNFVDLELMICVYSLLWDFSWI